MHLAETARAVGSPFLEGYVRLLIDAANLRSAVRCARMGKGSDFLSQVLLPGGNVEAHVLTSGKGNDLAAVDRARNQWRTLSGAGIAMEYWSEADGRWEKKR